MALLFFIASFGQNFSIDFYLDDLAKIVLMSLSVGMVFLSLWDKKEKIIENRRKNKLKRLLLKQRKTLKNHFDLRKKLAANSSLNFVFNLSDTLEREKVIKEKAITSVDPSAPLTEKINSTVPGKTHFSQINLAQTVIDGEDISSFPPEWQKFFIENEGKPPTEKLNKMLENGNA